MSTYENVSFQVQKGQAVELRALLPDHAATLRALLAEPELSPHIVMRGDRLSGAAQDKLVHRMVNAQDPGAVHAGIYCSEVPDLIGIISLQCWNRRTGSALLGYMLDPAWWGRGFATEAVGLMLNYAHQELGITEVEGRCRGSNLRSAKVMQKNGMQYMRSIPVITEKDEITMVFRLLHN
ncbi:GNAT family N-acetyltransferase [Paenibacillus sp. sgz500958]|uniref:GNAT family N-acetyltransferase n=1 Tax=Paenibacillus sp. sgz500958 TaxID=3242475 RepID=UPI0036D3DA85